MAGSRLLLRCEIGDSEQFLGVQKLLTVPNFGNLDDDFSADADGCRIVEELRLGSGSRQGHVDWGHQGRSGSAGHGYDFVGKQQGLINIVRDHDRRDRPAHRRTQTGQLLAQTGISLVVDPGNGWGYLQTVYGLIRGLHGDAALAWLAQGALTLGTTVIVWLAWRFGTRYPLKAALLSAATLIATPYAFAYDMAALVIPAAFLARDQLSRGLLIGDKTLWIILFGVPLAVLVTLGDNVGGPTFGGTPVGLFAAILLLAMILRRAIVTRPTVPIPVGCG